MPEPFRVIGHSVVLAITPFITEGGEGLGKTNKKRTATKSKGRGLEDGVSGLQQNCTEIQLAELKPSTELQTNSVYFSCFYLRLHH